MNLSDYSINIYPHISGINNQGNFIGALFNAAGSTYFPINPEYATDSYQRKLFKGTKPLTQEIRKSFPYPIKTEGLKLFFRNRIGSNALLVIMKNFGIPVDVFPEKELFAEALASQFCLIILETTSEVDNIVHSEYVALLNNYNTIIKPEINPQKLLPLYRGDEFLLVNVNSPPIHRVFFYEKSEHTWHIKNTGNVTWYNRYLECINQNASKVKALNPKIEIPTLSPGNIISLTAKFDGRGFEGPHESIWEIKDECDHLCFPALNKSLSFVVNVQNKVHH